MRGRVTLTNSIPDITKALAPKVSRIVGATAKQIEKRAKLRVQNPPKTGRVYMRNGIAHQASAKGESPATDIGNLASSIATTMDGDFTAIVGVGAEYGEVLEMGSKSGKLAERPYLKPAAEETRPEFEQAIADLLK